MLDTLAAVFKDGTTAVRTLYQLRSESNRLSVFEAIAQPWFDQVKLGGQFKEGIDAAYHCKNIRNQYAHCHWLDVNGVLKFCQLEEVARSKAANAEIKAHPISLPLIKEQSTYFDYTDHMLLWLNFKYRLKTNQSPRTEGIIPKPKRISPPKLNSREAGY